MKNGRSRKNRKEMGVLILLLLGTLLLAQGMGPLVFDLAGQVPEAHLLAYAEVVSQAAWRDSELQSALRQALLTYQEGGELAQLSQTTQKLLSPSSCFLKLRLGEDMGWIQHPVEVTLDSQPVGQLSSAGLVIQHVDVGRHTLGFDSPVTQFQVTQVQLLQPYTILEEDVSLSRAQCTVTLNTQPQGASVWVDGQRRRGTTPLSVDFVVGQNYLLAFEAAGYNRSETSFRQPQKGNAIAPTFALEKNLPPNKPMKIQREGKVPSITPLLEWKCTDPEGEKLSYEVYLEGKLATTTQLTQYTPQNLAYGKTYSWFIVAKDGHENQTQGVEWTFVTPESPPTFALAISSEPDGAEIWRNEEKLGSTPLTLDLPAGTYTLEARKEGYITQAQEVELGGGQEKDFERVPSAQTLHFVLERRTGKVTITTQPNDAKIIIEKVFRANGSYTYEGPEGTILVQVEKEGYKSQLQSFQVEAGMEKTLNITLEKEPPVTGTLHIINPDKNSVYIDGVFAGWDEEYKKPVQPGSHTVDYKASGKTVSKVEISIKAGQEVVVQKNKPVPTPSDDPNPPPSPSSIPIPEGMVKVERGTYPVGTSTVALSCGFLIAKTEVTFAEYDAYCIATGKAKPSDANWGRKEQPVINVSWKEAAAYCNWLSKKEGYAPAYDESTWGLLDASGNPTTDIASVQGYRLPTEAEWEVAASGGQNRDQVHKFAGNDLIDKVAWHHGNSGEWVTETIKTFWEEKKVTVMKNHHAHPVGKKDPNELGLYDMSGNVYEWCHDWYGEQFPASSSDPTGPSSGVYRVIRGGSWFAGATACEVSSRGTMNADIRNSETGFRVAQTHE